MSIYTFLHNWDLWRFRLWTIWLSSEFVVSHSRIFPIFIFYSCILCI